MTLFGRHPKYSSCLHPWPWFGLIEEISILDCGSWMAGAQMVEHHGWGYSTDECAQNRSSWLALFIVMPQKQKQTRQHITTYTTQQGPCTPHTQWNFLIPCTYFSCTSQKVIISPNFHDNIVISVMNTKCICKNIEKATEIYTWCIYIYHTYEVLLYCSAPLNQKLWFRHCLAHPVIARYCWNTECRNYNLDFTGA
jgi:hypothetical protein